MQVEETTQSDLRPTRAGFVRGLPLSMPVEEVIERGREAGIQLQPSDIHAARYYMRQGGGAPQQLTLGGTFASKRDGRNGGNGANGAGGQLLDASNGKSDALKKTSVVNKLVDPDDDDDEDAAPAVLASAPRRRKIVHSKATIEAAQAKESKDSNGVALHDRLQARLANATFRETARENAREERKAERQAAREERQTARETAREAEREERKAERLAAREQRQNARQNVRQNARQAELQNARQSARAKQERQARQERLEKATIGKALLNADSIKSRKRAAQATEVLEEQLRLIALRLGTQRVRELVDAMEALAARKA